MTVAHDSGGDSGVGRPETHFHFRVPGVEAWAGRFPGPSLIPELTAIQSRLGWLPRDELQVLRGLLSGSVTPGEVISTLIESGLRGMGGLKGLLVGMLCVGAEQGWVFIRHEYGPEEHLLRTEIEALYAEGLLGVDVLGSGRALRLEVVTSPGGYILGEESALIECMEGHCGEPRNKPPLAMAGGARIAAVQPGGASSNSLGPDQLDVPLDFATLTAAGSMLGSGALVAIAQGTDLLAAATNVLRFFRDESCGKCVLTELDHVMRKTSICGLGQVALGPVTSVLTLPAWPPTS